LSVNNKCKEAHSVFIGVDLDIFDSFANKGQIQAKDDEVTLAYIGTLGHSYDIKLCIDGISLLKDKAKIKFIVMGDGPLKPEFEGYALKKDINAVFTGSLKYSEMVKTLTGCHIAVNPIVPKAMQSIINKHGDYAAAGLPVLNTQATQEYRELVADYNIGLNCISGDPNDFAKNLLILCSDKELRQEMGNNHRRLAKEKFDRKIAYTTIVDILMKLAKEKT
jgi:glycosyltransferase involved in cell wall biosynthesis